MNKIESRRKYRRLRLLWLASILFCSIVVVSIVFDMVYSSQNSIVQPLEYQSPTLNVTQQDILPEENETEFLGLKVNISNKIPNLYNNIPIIRLGGARGTTFEAITSKINNFTSFQYVPVSVFNSTIVPDNIALTFYLTNNTAMGNIKTTRGKHFIKFDVFATPPESVKLLVEANGQKTIVAIYNAKLLRWQTVYVETGEVGIDETISLRFTFLEDTPPKYANSKFDRNAFIRDINIITLK
ncbi:MAG: hypothetical protein AABX51_06025 [Nanoarchaeota archaeon]